MSHHSVEIGAWSYVLDEPARLLVVDDDPILLEFASVHLATPAAAVETAMNGADALQRLTSRPFDIALVDIEMPGLDGFALLEKIRAEPKLRHLPVMMLTGHEDIASIDRAYGLGANAFATKPVNWRQLSYQVRYVLRTSRMEHGLRRARDLAEAKELSTSGNFEAIEQEYRDVLSSIVHCTHAGRRGDGDAQRLTSQMQHIEALALAMLARRNGIAPPAAEPSMPVAASCRSKAPLAAEIGELYAGK